MKSKDNGYKKLLSYICNALGICVSSKEQKAVKELLHKAGSDQHKLGSEKRRYLRARVEGRAGGYIIARVKGDYANNFMKLLGISFGGALLESAVAFRKGQMIYFKMYLPAYSRPINVKAEVVRALSAKHIGIRFLDISRDGKRKLFETISLLVREGNSSLSGDISAAITGKANPHQCYSSLRKRYFNNTIRHLIYLMEASDKYNHKHSENVVKYVTRIARNLKLTRYDILKVKVAALLHDLGKYDIDKAILYKVGQLSEREWCEIKKHPVTSEKMMKKTGVFSEITGLVRNHHARYGGGGYPEQEMKGTEIPLGARIISVADSYDAMVSNRVYRKNKKTKRSALYELKKYAGTQFDPRIVAAFAV